MWLLAFLSAYAALLGTVAGRQLAAARWPARAPVLAVLLWQVLTVSLVITLLSAAALLFLPDAELGDGLAAFLRTCAHTLRERYARVAGALVATAGLALLLAVTGRLLWCLTAELRACRRGRSAQLERVRLAANHDRELDAYVIDDGRAVVFCIPGRRPAVVVTSAAVRALEPDELHAVLAHESAHLRWRHDLVMAMTSAVARAFPFVPTFRLAHQHVGQLVEMVADDVAARRHGSHIVGSALVRLAGVEPPRFALGATGTAGFARAQRLLVPVTGLGYARRGAVLAVTANMLALPLVVTVGPALATAVTHHCPLML